MRYDCQIIRYTDGSGYTLKLSEPTPARAVPGIDCENEQDLIDRLREMHVNDDGIVDLLRQLDAKGRTDIFPLCLSDEVSSHSSLGR